MIVNNLSFQNPGFPAFKCRQFVTGCDMILFAKKDEVKLMSHTFKGGVHPNYMKAPEIPISVITPPPQVIIPMTQHIGAPCKPLVQVGDYVKMGQKIGENPAPVSAPVHASVSGKAAA